MHYDYPHNHHRVCQLKLTRHMNKTDWPAEETESAAQTANGDGTTQHLWEESWDDDDTSDDFSSQLRYVLRYPLPRSLNPFLLHLSLLSSNTWKTYPLRKLGT